MWTGRAVDSNVRPEARAVCFHGEASVWRRKDGRFCASLLVKGKICATLRTLMLVRGVAAKVASEMLGHSTIGSPSTCTRTSRKACSGRPRRRSTDSSGAEERP